MPAYVVAFMDVSDDAKYDSEYVAYVVPLVAKHGGKPLALTADPDIREGDWPSGRNILIEFPDRAAAEAWYEDPEYLPYIKIRNELAEGGLAILDGV